MICSWWIVTFFSGEGGSGEERKELESYLVIEYLMELVKLEAHRQLRQQAS